MKEHLSTSPYHLSDDVWVYESEGGLDIVVRQHSGTIHRLPKRKIYAYLRRLNKQKELVTVPR